MSMHVVGAEVCLVSTRAKGAPHVGPGEIRRTVWTPWAEMYDYQRGYRPLYDRVVSPGFIVFLLPRAR